ncbi:MAG TPA: GNAT family N-acetyltransferase [Thermoleophilaceae bacterium]|nr:GNAT family N-acetyltransferase [Thermoleophilaceae bacterium]
MTTTAPPRRVTVREVEPGDADACARICFDAFAGIHDHHRFPRDFPALEAAAGIMGIWVPHPSIWGVVAELDGRIVGSNFIDERDSIRAVGPITVEPKGQNAGVGRQLMEAVLERAEGAPGIRLTQDAFNVQSLSLYESLGFDVKEPLVVIGGQTSSAPSAGVQVRPLREDDVDACAALCRKVHGFDRTNELRDAIRAFQPFAAVRNGRITAYASSAVFWPLNHGVAESDEDMRALLLGASAATDEPIELLVPLRSDLFRWCLGEGLRVVKPVNLMAIGDYREPRSAWFPSVLY